MKRKKFKNLIVALAGIGLLLSGIIQCDSGNNNNNTFSGPLELVYPKGGNGQSFKVGDTVKIIWYMNQDSITSVAITYSLDSGKTWTNYSIGGNSYLHPDTSYVWVVDSTKISNQFVLIVYDYLYRNIYDKSAPFVIKAASH